MYILIFAKVFQTISTYGEGFNLAGTIEYIVFRTAKVRYLTTYSPTTADFSIITALDACIICSCVDTAARVAVFTATDASPNTSWFTLLQYTRTIHIVSYYTPCIEITYYSGTNTTHMRCIVRTTNNRIRIYWFRCWYYRCNWFWIWSHRCNWFWIRSYRCNWFWIWSWCRFWFWHYIGALAITIFPCNIPFFLVCSQRFFVTRHDTFRSDGYSTRKVSFTFYIVFIIEFVG